VAATGLAAIMVVAVIVHIRIRDRFAHDAPAVVLGLLATFVAWGRFRPRSF